VASVGEVQGRAPAFLEAPGTLNEPWLRAIQRPANRAKPKRRRADALQSYYFLCGVVSTPHICRPNNRGAEVTLR